MVTPPTISNRRYGRLSNADPLWLWPCITGVRFIGVRDVYHVMVIRSGDTLIIT